MAGVVDEAAAAELVVVPVPVLVPVLVPVPTPTVMLDDPELKY